MADEAPTPRGQAARATEVTKRVLKAVVFEQTKAKAAMDTGESRELPPDDLLTNLTADGRILLAPFDKLTLAMLPEQSTSLNPVIQAMAINIDGHGHRLACRVNLDDKNVDDATKLAVNKERVKLVNFFNTCCDEEISFTELRKRTRVDVEATGEGFWELIRTTNGDLVGLNHIPSYQINLSAQDKDFTTYQRTVPILQEDGSVKLGLVSARKRFRRFIQARISIFSRGASFGRGQYELRWFKEHGDPRMIDNRTGEVVPSDKLKDMPPDQQASEMIHWKIYSPRTPYGLPRYVGNMITVFGDRAADEINYVTLRNNNVPSMALLVSNGQLTQGTIDRIQQFVESQIQGSDNYSRFLLLEGEGNFEGPETANMKIDIRPLTSEQMRDSLFQEYCKNNEAKIRGAFRLPPIFVGQTQDYTRSTAEESRRLADEQVFSPERDEFDQQINMRIMPELGVIYHSFKSNGPNVTDDQDMIQIMAAGEKSGCITPRIARMMLSDILGMDERDLPPLDTSVNLDIPFSLQMAEKVKNTAPITAQAAVKALAEGQAALKAELEEYLTTRRHAA